MGDKLQSILDKLGDKKKDYIVFFDEVHNVMKGTADIGERLKTILDTNPNGLPYCIAATTLDEYKKLVVPDAAFTRRFQKVNINPTDKKQTMLIMREMISRDAPEIGVTETILEKIFEATTKEMPNLNQPASSKRILSKAISSIRLREELLTSPAILEKQNELASVSSALRAAPASEEMLDKIHTLQQEIEKLKEAQAAANKTSTALHQLKRFRAEQIASMFSMALKASEDSQAKTEATRFVFWNYYVVPFLLGKIEAYSDNATLQINDQLVDELLAKEEVPEIAAVE
ncbi:MAG: ATP-dependent Clp protease ATP-binding subunit [Verrucomicrobia bacterium]|nr:ATP-dependent Clp protease ATP-binding subunit [Verrucomicrobiota bacterium]